MELSYHYETMSLEDHQNLAVPVGDGGNYHRLIGMNDTGLYLFDLLRKNFTEREIVERMSLKYDIPREAMAKDVRKGIQELLEMGALK